MSYDIAGGAASKTGMKRKIAGNLGWVMGLQFGQRGLEIFFLAVMARLLAPAEFGVVAAAMVFVQFAQLLVEIGIGATLVQLPDLSSRDIRAASTLVLLNSVFYAILTVILAPLAGIVIRIPQMVAVLQVLSLMFVIQAVGIVPENLLIRRLEVRKVQMMQMLAKVVGTGGVGIGLALLGWSYWALVVASLVEAGVKAFGLTLIVRPPRKPLLNRELSRRILSRSSGFSISRVLNFFAIRGDKLLVGRYLDAFNLGLYSRAYSLMSIPADLYSTIAERLLFPALAHVQDDLPRLRRAFLQVTELTALVGFPMSVALMLLAPQLVDVVLGNKWHAVTVAFAVLSAATYFRLGARVSGSVQRARGAFSAMISTQAIYAALVVAGCILAAPFGIVAIAGAMSLTIAIFYGIITWHSCRIVSVPLGAMLRAHAPGALMAGLTALLLYAGRGLAAELRLGSFPTLILCGCVMAPLALFIVLFQPRWLVGETAAAAIRSGVHGVRRFLAKRRLSPLEHGPAA